MLGADQEFGGLGTPSHMGPYDAVIIGASFGGPPAVEAVLSELPRKFPAPIAICQHICPGFTAGWAARLNRITKLKVSEAKSGTMIEPGHVYVAPAGYQTRFTRVGKEVYLRVDEDYADSLYVPSVDQMMRSAPAAFGSHTLGILLTGLGSDGASGMLAIRQAGGYTIAESADTAASHSMPGSAVELGAVVEQLPIGKVASRVIELSMR